MATYTNIALLNDGDQRRRAPGLRGDCGWVGGNGSTPLGWEPWDYEQGEGYQRVRIGPREHPWDPRHLSSWSLDEVGLHEPDLTDEMEDWDLGPTRRIYARDRYYFEGDPRPLPEVP